MTAPNFPACLDVILQSEGGFTTSLKDGTVATNMGITLATLSTWLGRPASVAEIKALTVDTASQIYKRNYWDAVCGDQLPAGLDLLVFDCAVNQGTATAARILRDSLSVTKDGVIGPATLATVANANIPKLIDRVVQLRADIYHGLHLFPLYGAGWMARLYRTAALAHGMVAPVAPTPAAPQEAPLPDPAPTPAPIPGTVSVAGGGPVTAYPPPTAIADITTLKPLIVQAVKEASSGPVTVSALMTDTKPIWTSKTFWGLVVSGLGAALNNLGYQFTNGDAADLIQYGTSIVMGGGMLFAMYGRVMASKKVR